MSTETKPKGTIMDAHEALIQAEMDALEAALSHDSELYESACQRVREAERREAMDRHPSIRGEQK